MTSFYPSRKEEGVALRRPLKGRRRSFGIKKYRSVIPYQNLKMTLGILMSSWFQILDMRARVSFFTKPSIAVRHGKGLLWFSKPAGQPHVSASRREHRAIKWLC